MSLQLPLTSIEKYHLVDDRPTHPNVIGVQLTLAGRLDHDVATLAMRESSRRHPLGFARLSRGRFGRLHWRNDDATVESLNWGEVVCHSRADSARMIDLWHEPPVRIVERVEGERTILGFHMHHAAMDGLGGLQYMIDFLLAYHRILTRRDRPKPRQVDADLLGDRNHLRLLSREFLGRLWIQPIAMMGAVNFMIRKVQSLASQHPDASDPAPGEAISMVSCQLDERELQLLNRLAGEANATINELLVKSVFLAMHRLRKELGQHRMGEILRIMIPINIRTYADRRLPAANRASMVQLDRTDKDFDRGQGMVWGLNYELGNIRHWNLEKTFLLLIRCVSIVPGLLKRLADKQVCRATSVLTNLGAPLDRIKLDRVDGKIVVGNLLVEDIDLIVPLRPMTAVGFAAVRYAGIQKLNMHFDPTQIQPQHAARLIELVRQELLPNQAETTAK